jgi:hypothetical protein
VRVVTAVIIATLLLACRPDVVRAPTAAPAAADACGSWASPADFDGRLIGATADSTKIRVRVPAGLRAGTEVRLDWHMTSGPGTAPLTMYAERANLRSSTARVQPRRIDPVDSENDYAVFITLPEAGCWRMHGERGGGKLSGDIWMSVLAGS